MKRGRCVDQIESGGRALEIFEPTADEFVCGESPSALGYEMPARIHADLPGLKILEESRGLPGSASDLENAAAQLQRSAFSDSVSDPDRIAWSKPLITTSISIEQFAEAWHGRST